MSKIWQKNNTNIIENNNHIDVYKINVYYYIKIIRNKK